MDVCTLPFNAFIGLEPTATEAGPGIKLLPLPQHLNHVGTVHASLLCAVGEAAAGAALVERFPELVEQGVMPVLRRASLKYRLPAVSEAEIIGIGTVGNETANEFSQSLSSRGKGLLEIEVVVNQLEKAVFRADYTFYVATTT